MQERFEESPFYQMILEHGEEKGFEKGVEKGLEKGVRKSLLYLVEAKYPDSDLPQLTKALTTYLEDQDVLLNLLTGIGTTTLPEEARALLLASIQSPRTKH
jgi:hypothetical protein